MQLIKSAATLDELLNQEQEIRSSIKDQKRQLKTLVATRKQFQKFASLVSPHENNHRVRSRKKRVSKRRARKVAAAKETPSA